MEKGLRFRLKPAEDGRVFLLKEDGTPYFSKYGLYYMRFGEYNLFSLNPDNNTNEFYKYIDVICDRDMRLMFESDFENARLIIHDKTEYLLIHLYNTKSALFSRSKPLLSLEDTHLDQTDNRKFLKVWQELDEWKSQSRLLDFNTLNPVSGWYDGIQETSCGNKSVFFCHDGNQFKIMDDDFRPYIDWMNVDKLRYAQKLVENGY